MSVRTNPYADYGKGRELRELVDQLEDAQRAFIKAQETAGRAIGELHRVTQVVSALAEEFRRKRKTPCR